MESTDAIEDTPDDASTKNQGETAEKRKTSKLAKASLIFAVLSVPPFCFLGFSLPWWLFPIALLFPILAISFAVVALVLVFRSKGRLKGKGYAVTVLAGALFLICVDSVFPLLSHLYYVMSLQNVMLSPFFYKRAARELAQYCRVMETEVHGTGIGNTWYPRTIRLLRPSHVSISPQRARIKFTGGFYHLDYIVELDQTASTDRQSVWNLSMVSESSPFHLYTLRLDKEDEITFDQFIQKAVDGYDRYPRQASAKIIFLLLFERYDMAYESCKKMSEDRPKAWWPRLALAFMESARTDSGEAGRNLAQWVEKYPCYTHYYYLSFFYQKQNDAEKACQAIQKSIEYPMIHDVYSPDRRNVYSLASDAVIVALNNQKYDLALEICDAALAQLEHERGRFSSAPYWKLTFRKLRLAIADTDQNTINKWIEYKAWAGSFNPYQDGSTNRIQRIRVGNHFFPSDEEIEARNRPYEPTESIIREWQSQDE